MNSPVEGVLDLIGRYDREALRAVRVGLLLPWANVAVEEELPRCGLVNTVFHHARLVPASGTTAVGASFWHGLRGAAAEAVESMVHLPLDATVLACTSAGFTDGPPLPAGTVTAFDVLVEGLRAMKAQQVVLVTPYPDRVTCAEAEALRDAGFTVLAHASLGLDDGYADVPPGEVRRLLRELPTEPLSTADAVVLSCTGWHTLTCVEPLERDLGKPVLSSNLAIALHAARLSAGVIP
ncbi:maleate cis-trans isomerase family protein [Streptomyces tsukubensis]|uniref:maleate cis-trans isomerase family protein n=1 Tax=Streptomyces tsukubensis TaxID=83656 RepID=UPI00344E4512